MTGLWTIQRAQALICLGRRGTELTWPTARRRWAPRSAPDAESRTAIRTASSKTTPVIASVLVILKPDDVVDEADADAAEVDVTLVPASSVAGLGSVARPVVLQVLVPAPTIASDV